MNARHLKRGLPGLFMVLVICFFYLQSARDTASLETIETRLNEIEQLNNLLNQEIVQVRQGLSHNYDQLSLAMAQMQVNMSGLHVSSDAIGVKAAGRFNERLNELVNLQHQRLEAIERFKAHNAVLTFVIRQTPHAARQLAFVVHGDSLLADAQRKNIIEQSGRLVHEILYSLAGNLEPRARLERRMRTLETMAERASGPVHDSLLKLIRNAGAVFENSDAAGSLLQTLVNDASPQTIAELKQIFLAGDSAMQDRARIYQFLLFASCLVLLLWLGLVLWRLRKTIVALRDSVDDIQVLARYPEESPEAILRVSGEGVLRYANGPGMELAKFWETAPGLALPDEWLQRVKASLASNATLESEISLNDVQQLVRVVPVQDAGYVHIYGSDISRLKDVEVQLEKEKHQAELTLHAIDDIVITTDDQWRVNYMNAKAAGLTGWNPEMALGKNVEEIVPMYAEASGEATINPVAECLASGLTVEEHEGAFLRNRYGREFIVDYSVSPIFGANGQALGTVLVARDITESRKLQERLEFQSQHDALTGLINRETFKIRLETLLRSNVLGKGDYALMYMDVDQFKTINDASGHVAGDELLRQVGSIMQSQIRDTDVLARMGSDEFCLLLEKCPRDQALHVAQGLIESVESTSFNWDGRHFLVSLTVGLVMLDGKSDDVSSVLLNADTACRHAKKFKRGGIHEYRGDTEISHRKEQDLQLMEQLRQALADDSFVIYAQSIESLAAADVGARRIHVVPWMIGGDGKLSSLDSFIAIADRYALMPQIDQWVIERALQMTAEALDWSASGADLSVAISLSGASLSSDNFLPFVREQLFKYRVPAEKVCFEVSEQAAMTSLATTVQTIAGLRDLGCGFALAGFGQGMSSFASLKELGADYVKIDVALVRDVVTDPVDRAMVESIIHVLDALGVESVASGVDTAELLEALKTCGISSVQGEGIASAEPMQELLGLGSLQLPVNH